MNPLPDGRGFILAEPKEKIVMSAEDIRRAVARIAHEIVERNHGAANLMLLGMLTRGAPLAARLAKSLHQLEGIVVPVGSLDISLYRDDLSSRGRIVIKRTDIPESMETKLVVLIDDVLFTGRSIRAALDAITDFGRPSSIQLAVLVDRGHRELPIRPDYIGRNIPTALYEDITVRLVETDGVDEVVVTRREE